MEVARENRINLKKWTDLLVFRAALCILSNDELSWQSLLTIPYHRLGNDEKYLCGYVFLQVWK